jgi:hypothetical protein
MLGEQEQRLLAAHAPAEGVDAVRVERDVRQGAGDDPRHPREIGDLARIAPGERTEAAPLAVGRDDDELVASREVAPDASVLLAREASPVRRDHERERAVGLLDVQREQDGGLALDPVVRDVGDRQLPDERVLVRGRRDPCVRRRRREERGDDEQRGSDQAEAGQRSSDDTPRS